MQNDATARRSINSIFLTFAKKSGKVMARKRTLRIVVENLFEPHESQAPSELSAPVGGGQDPDPLDQVVVMVASEVEDAAVGRLSVLESPNLP